MSFISSILRNRTKLLIALSILFFYPVPMLHAAGKDKFVVVIDAGHGGHDYGAIDNGVNEKDINLGVALKLGEMIKKKLKDAEVVYTRSTDTFISLQGRADIANKAKGDLFISIHTNSVDKSNKNRTSVSGASTYVLGLHRDEDNLSVARRENSVMELEPDAGTTYSGFDPAKDESYIVFEMAQKKNLANSIKFAGEVQKEMVYAGRNSRGVHQAGFWVLWSTSMPSALIELDFICNPDEAKFLSSKDGQEKLAKAIFNAVKSYHEYYENSLKHHSQTSPVPAPKEEAKMLTLVETESTGDGEVTVLESMPVEETRQHLESTTLSTSQPARRKRRSSRSKAESENIGVQSAEIALVSENDYAYAVVEEPAPAPVATEAEKPQVRESKSKKTETRTYQNKKVQVASSGSEENVGRPARREKDGNGRKARKQNFTTLYKIQIMASAAPLDSNGESFKGLKPVSSFRENNLYKYTYGESTERLEMESLLVKIKEIFPDAFIIKCISD